MVGVTSIVTLQLRVSKHFYSHIGLLRTGISIKYPDVQFGFDCVRQKKRVVWTK